MWNLRRWNKDQRVSWEYDIKNDITFKPSYNDKSNPWELESNSFDEKLFKKFLRRILKKMHSIDLIPVGLTFDRSKKTIHHKSLQQSQILLCSWCPTLTKADPESLSHSPKFTIQHLNVKKRQRQKVKLAAQTVSHSNAKAITWL